MFTASKILGTLFDPAFLFSLALLAGTALLFTRRWRAGRALLAAAVGAGLLLTLLPLERALTEILETRFPRPAEPFGRVDGIIVLGGSISPQLSAATGEVGVNDAFERVLAFMALARRHPDARLIYSGGSGSALDQEHKEADFARLLFADLGLDPERVLFENNSRNTYENAVLSKEMARPRPGETWLLVTSAMHMPRSVGVFRQAGWEVVPYPVDFRTAASQPYTPRPDWNVPGAVGSLSGVVHEWMGLAYYRLRGWTGSLFPAP